jgi:hypothetical protein
VTQPLSKIVMFPDDDPIGVGGLNTFNIGAVGVS